MHVFHPLTSGLEMESKDCFLTIKSLQLLHILKLYVGLILKLGIYKLFANSATIYVDEFFLCSKNISNESTLASVASS